MYHVHDISTIALFSLDEIKALSEVVGAVITTTVAVGWGIAWFFEHWMTGMTEDFTSATLGVFSALLVAAFVELFASLRKGAEDKARIEVLHNSAILRSIATFNVGRTPDPNDRADVREYFSRIAKLQFRHKLHVFCCVVLSAILAILIGLLLQWLSLENRKGPVWDEFLPNASKVAYVLSIIYFGAVTTMRIDLERRILKWERRAKLAEYFQVPNVDQVFELEKRWRQQIKSDLDEELTSDENTVRAVPDRTPPQRPDPTPHARTQAHNDFETQTQHRNTTAAFGRRSRANTQRPPAQPRTRTAHPGRDTHQTDRQEHRPDG